MKMNLEKYNSPLLKIIVREFNRISERKTLYFLTIVLPIVLFIFLGLIYKNSVVRDLPIVIFDADNSEISRMIIRGADATSSMHIYKYVNSVDEIKQEFLKGKAQGAFYFPKGMEADLKSGKKSTVVLFKNTSNLIIGNLLYKDGMTLIRTISGGVLLKKIRSKGFSENQAMNIVNPIRLETHVLFNPNYNYTNYLMPGLLTALFQMIIMISGVLVISSEFTHPTFGELVQISGNSIVKILVGKSIPHIAIHIATAIGIIGVLFPAFSIEINGSLVQTFFLLVLFILAVFFPAMLISSFFHEQLFATELALFINTPAFIFSGFTFPLWSMPTAHNYFAMTIPFTHFITGFLKVYQMNAPIRYAQPEINVLLLFFLCSFVFTLFVLRYQVNNLSMKKLSDAGKTQ